MSEYRIHLAVVRVNLYRLKGPVAQFLLGKANGVGILRLGADGLCALRDPVPDDLFLIGCQLLGAVRHLVRGDLLPKQAGIGIAGYDGCAGVAPGLHQVHQPDVESAAFLFLLAVTMKTGGLEDRANVRLKPECLGVGGVCRLLRAGRQSGRPSLCVGHSSNWSAAMVQNRAGESTPIDRPPRLAKRLVLIVPPDREGYVAGDTYD